MSEVVKDSATRRLLLNLKKAATTATSDTRTLGVDMYASHASDAEDFLTMSESG